MEPQTPPTTTSRSLKPVYWVAALAMTAATVWAAIKEFDWQSIAGRSALIAALVLLATARPQETRGWKIAVYTLVAISLGLLLARLAR
jgi:hypothetical protein